MGLFDNIEKLITEHGSAEILRQRLELASDKYAQLEERVAAIAADNTTLKKERDTAVAQIQVLRQQISTAPSASQPLEPVDESILKSLLDAGGPVSLEQLCQQQQLQLGMGRYHIDRLTSRSLIRQVGVMVHVSGRMPPPERFDLTAKGREHIVQTLRSNEALER